MMEVERQERHPKQTFGEWRTILDGAERAVSDSGMANDLSRQPILRIVRGFYDPTWEYRRIPKDPLLLALAEAQEKL